MAHTATLTKATGSTIDLAQAVPDGSAGYALVDVRISSRIREAIRVNGAPYTDGERTIASSLKDNQIELIVRLTHTSADSLDTLMRQLEVFLEEVRIEAQKRTRGEVGRFAWKRQGVTNTAYWRITDVPTMPEPIPEDNEFWAETAAITHWAAVRFVLTVEPLPHAAALTTAVSAVAGTNTRAGNTQSYTPALGTMESPVSISLTRTSAGTDWAEVWIAQINARTLYDATAVADPTSAGGVEEYNATGTENGGGFSPTEALANKHRNRMRPIMRVKPRVGTPASLRMQVRLYLDAGFTRFVSTDWISLPSGAVNNSWYLVDFGAIEPLIFLADRADSTALSNMLWYFAFKTSDGTNVDFSVDYTEILYCRSFLKVSNLTLGNGGTLWVEDVGAAGSFIYPMISTNVYSSTNTAARRRGRLTRHIPNEFTTVWVAGLNAGQIHPHADTFTTTVKYLPMYSSGWRGAS